MKNEFENIDDGFLKNLGNEGGFSAPEAYFEKSKNSILNKINKEPSLNISGNEGGFVLPNNYFEQGKNAILSKIQKPDAKKINLFNWKTVSGIAALFIAVVGLTIFINNNNSNNLNANLNKVSEEEMIEYLTNNDVKIEWINEVKPINQIDNKEENNTKEVEQYLMEHADEQALLEEL